MIWDILRVIMEVVAVIAVLTLIGIGYVLYHFWDVDWEGRERVAMSKGLTMLQAWAIECEREARKKKRREKWRVFWHGP